MDRLFLYYQIGEGETAETPDLPGIKHDKAARVVSIPVKAQFSIQNLLDNSWSTSDPQAGIFIREFEKENANKKEYKIWKSEVKTNIPIDGFLDYFEEKGKTIVNVGIFLLGLYLINKFFLSKNEK